MPRKKKRKLTRLNPFYVPQAVDRIALLCAQVFGKVKKIEGILTEDPGPYVYFVAYQYRFYDGKIQMNNSVVTRDRPITTPEDLEEIKAELSEDLNCIISNFIRLED